jgi:hypothetical protein
MISRAEAVVVVLGIITRTCDPKPVGREAPFLFRAGRDGERSSQASSNSSSPKRVARQSHFRADSPLFPCAASDSVAMCSWRAGISARASALHIASNDPLKGELAKCPQPFLRGAEVGLALNNKIW